MAGNTEYKREWAKENLDRISLTVPKGYKETIHTHAAAHNESLNSFIKRAIKETMERDLVLDVRMNDAAAVGECEIAAEDHAELKETTEPATISKPESTYYSYTFSAKTPRKLRENEVSVVYPTSPPSPRDTK